MSTTATSCPFCDSPEVELVSAWGGALMVSQMHCRGCNSHFEAVRDDFAARSAEAPVEERAWHPADERP